MQYEGLSLYILPLVSPGSPLHIPPKVPDINFDWTVSNKEVHLWIQRIQWGGGLVEYGTLLSREECARRDRFRNITDKYRFLAGRGLMRTLIGNYTGFDPQKVMFEYTGHGKPLLAGNTEWVALSFNLSHTCSHVAVAITMDRSVGVDIHDVNQVGVEGLMHAAAVVFTPDEYNALCACAADSRPQFFAQLWTVKEALGKAIGTGLIALQHALGYIQCHPGGVSTWQITSSGQGVLWYATLLFEEGVWGSVAVRK